MEQTDGWFRRTSSNSGVSNVRGFSPYYDQLVSGVIYIYNPPQMSESQWITGVKNWGEQNPLLIGVTTCNPIYNW